MKVILYMAITANGYIAKENDDTSFVSKNSWKEYERIVEESDCVIVGRRTYEIMSSEEFVKGKHYVIFTHNTNLKKKTDNVRFTNENLKLALRSLEKEGFDDALVVGGGTLNALFMAENLVDEIYLDIEPIVFGKGINLFGRSDFETKLKLLNIRKLSDNEVQLHYQVLK